MWVQRGEVPIPISWPRHALCFSPEPMSSEVKELPQVTKEQGVWVVRLERAGGKKQEYRCATEAQARALAVALSKLDEA